MDWRAKVELFEQIRREYEFGVGTIAGVAQKLGVHRRMVREAIGNAMPKPRKKTERPRWKLKAAVEFVDAVLEADRKAPRKQRHTAHRIWQRIRAGAARLQDRRTNRSAVCSRSQDRAGAAGARNLRAAELCLGRGGAGGLVRSLCRSCRRTGEAAGVRDAQHGQWSGVPLRLSACDAAGVSGSS